MPILDTTLKEPLVTRQAAHEGIHERIHYNQEARQYRYSGCAATALALKSRRARQGSAPLRATTSFGLCSRLHLASTSVSFAAPCTLIAG